MSEGIALIISAIITVGGMVLVQFFSHLQRKADSRDRFFYEVYPRRLMVYEEVLNELGTMGNPDEVFFKTNPLDFSTKIMQSIHTLNGLLLRLHLYGSSDSTGILNLLIVKLNSMLVQSGTPVHAADSGTFFTEIGLARAGFVEMVAREAAAKMVDKKIFQFLKKPKLKKYPGRDV
jgi:hypothetical protein